MCGYGNSNDNELKIYLGWYGSCLSMDGGVYNPQNNEFYDESSVDKQTIIDKIKAKYDYDGFINAILECINNGEEG